MTAHSMPRVAGGRQTFICDFDGTITGLDVTDNLLETFADPAWMGVEELWVNGRIDARECMVRQVGMIEADIFTIDRHLQAIEIDADFPEFVREQYAVGNDIHVVSDGIDYVIHRILGRYGLDYLPVHANHLVQLSSTRYSLEFGNAADGCALGTCKCVFMQGTRESTVVIGDGRSDFCVAGEADMVFAKGDLARYCASTGISHVAFETFRDVREHFVSGIRKKCI